MFDEKDDFWDIASLLPRTKKTRPFVSAEVSTASVVSESPAASSAREEEERKLRFFEEDAEKGVREYAPVDNPLLKRVRIRCLKSNYRFFRAFREDAVQYLNQEAKECPYVPFFSYIPQYAQMNGAQLAYYLYFRRQAREGKYIETNQSYFLLYVYEIINLPDKISPSEGVLFLAKIWAAYRETIPNVDRMMVNWLSDYALVHGVPCPNDVLLPFLEKILPLSRCKEFYLGQGTDLSDCRLQAFLTLSSEYKYQTGRYVESENGSLFLQHIPCAMKAVVKELFQTESNVALCQTVEKEYEAYQGALCAEEYKYSISVSYCSVSGTEALKYLITLAVKYAENKVRAYLAIKSRLSVTGLSQKYRDIIDTYFAQSLPKKKREEREEIAEYEAYYAAPSRGISREEAQKIENTSWQNTFRLIAEEEKQEMLSSPLPHDEERAQEQALLSQNDGKILAALFWNGENAAKDTAKKCGVLFATACERINEYFVSTMGDIIMEIGENGVLLLDDYETEVRTFLESLEEHGSNE